MHRLEVYAKEKEQEKEYLKQAITLLLEAKYLNREKLERAIDKAFILGHHAGHCRGESYKNRLRDGAV